MRPRPTEVYPIYQLTLMNPMSPTDGLNCALVKFHYSEPIPYPIQTTSSRHTSTITYKSILSSWRVFLAAPYHGILMGCRLQLPISSPVRRSPPLRKMFSRTWSSNLLIVDFHQHGTEWRKWAIYCFKHNVVQNISPLESTGLIGFSIESGRFLHATGANPWTTFVPMQ